MSDFFQLKPTVASQLYRDVKAKYYRKFQDRYIAPWMRSKEIDLIGEALHNIQPKRVFEWGAGYSTVFFPQLLQGEFEWTSVEHNTGWATKLKEIIHDPRITVHNILPDDPNFVDKHNEGTLEEFHTYVNMPQGKYDFIFIDGRARAECMKKALNHLSEGGLVILHDANRKHYHTYSHLYPHQVLMKDYHKNRGGVWLGSATRKIEDIVDMEKHHKLWGTHYIIGKASFKS
ncbi:class I SAM-dependent methyltransferase [Pontibacter mangrovi]|uniref:Class I SAM-dependent methyltransferase n=1 Tax=Pontibacter mangrovi TaxID=2589816 RepID=A0A501W5J1_9BACT|nr:class I SAM-dependent methyltransferase [Pontibacter mangrovi]TPE44002.1 class I SAM-dependent methyltransferase [Pontibacter mangrovi]